MDEHEDPYMVAGNTASLQPGHAFSVEPGIYIPGRWGMRLEDIVVATDDGPRALNTANHDLVVVDAQNSHIRRHGQPRHAAGRRDQRGIRVVGRSGWNAWPWRSRSF